MSLFHTSALGPRRRLLVVSTLLLSVLCVLSVGWASADWERAVEAYQRGDLTVAIEELEGVVEAHPNYGPAHSFLGAALYRAGRVEESVVPLRRGLELGADDEASRLVLARALVDLERYDEATSEVKSITGKSLRTDQRVQWEDVLRSLAARATDLQTLQPIVSSAVERFPDNAELWTSLGRLDERLNRGSESLQSLARAARLEPSSARRARYLETALRFGELAPDEGSEWYRSAAEEAGAWADVEPGTALLIAECWLGAEGCKGALSWLDRAAVGPSAGKALLYRGQCAAVAQDPAAAIEFLEAARERSAEDSATLQRILIALGDAYHAGHRYDDAAVIFAQAGETDRAAAMESAQQASLHNAALDLQIAECQERRDKYDALLAEYRDLEGTADWVDLLRTYEEKLKGCRAYL
ncbi:MAG: tetratricopeptide repeat protein [Thermoanaerobaculia bacterium]|nr:tetratricopeptide repeat protein [Thermoanaerobaculia bacterium]